MCVCVFVCVCVCVYVHAFVFILPAAIAQWFPGENDGQITMNYHGIQ